VNSFETVLWKPAYEVAWDLVTQDEMLTASVASFHHGSSAAFAMILNKSSVRSLSARCCVTCRSFWTGHRMSAGDAKAINEATLGVVPGAAHPVTVGLLKSCLTSLVFVLVVASFRKQSSPWLL